MSASHARLALLRRYNINGWPVDVVSVQCRRACGNAVTVELTAVPPLFMVRRARARGTSSRFGLTRLASPDAIGAAGRKLAALR